MPCYMCVRWPTFSAALFLEVFFSKGKDKKAMNQTNQLWDDFKKKEKKSWKPEEKQHKWLITFILLWWNELQSNEALRMT